MNEGGLSLPLLPPTTVSFSPGKEVTCLSEQESGHGYAAGRHQFCLSPTRMFTHTQTHKQSALELQLLIVFRID